MKFDLIIISFGDVKNLVGRRLHVVTRAAAPLIFILNRKTCKTLNGHNPATADVTDWGGRNAL